MALNPVITSSMVIKGLYESHALFNRCRRDLDGLVTSKWAQSVDVPRNPQLVVRGTAAALGSADRKKTKADMSTVNAPFQLRLIHITEEYESRAETNGDALSAFVSDVVRAFEKDFNMLCMNEALASAVLAGGENLQEWTGDELQKKDLDRIKMYFIGKEIPEEDQIVIVPASAGESFKNIDIVKNAMAFNKDLLEKGVAVIDKVTYLISANLDLVDDKPALVGLYSKGLAFVIKKYLDREEAWNTEATVKYIDYMAYVAAKLTKTEFSIGLVQP
ncbi:MAG: hypothetical protein HGGPFJEG_03065 [Ignavibacteria bacterium]|nr:hypothetical protein [Ignavibacteria bacterium]